MTAHAAKPRPHILGKLAVLTALYFAQGLPFGFFALAVPVLLRRSGTPLHLVGLSSLLPLPWGLKFLWAPSVERHYSERIGRRKSWILPMQALNAATLIALAFVPHSSQTPLLVAFVVVSAISATQDIATDGLAIDLLDERERAGANGIQVGAYRAGMIAGGGGILWVSSALGLREAFLLMAAIVALSSVPVFFLREPAHERPAPSPSALGSAFAPILSFLRREDAIRIVALAALYKLGESVAAGMMKPFFVDSGFSDAEIAFSRGLVGGASAICGAVIAGITINRLGRRWSLALFGGLQVVPIGLYALVAATRPDHGLFTAMVVIEQAVFAAATTALFTRMMDLCRDDHRASDYTALACVVVAASGIGMAMSGFVAHRLGYVGLFVIAAVVALAAPLAALFADRSEAPTASRTRLR